MDKIPKCADHLTEATEQYFPVVLFYYAVQYGSSLYRKKKELTICTDGPHL